MIHARHLVLAALALSGAGCVVHEARVTVPPAPSAGPGSKAPPTRMVVGTRPSAPASKDPVVLRGPLPQDVQVSAWHMDADGSILCRAEQRVTTPLSWWQRFPCDIVSDLIPADVVARSEATLECRPVPATDAAALAESARCDGYAHDEAMPTRHAR